MDESRNESHEEKHIKEQLESFPQIGGSFRETGENVKKELTKVFQLEFGRRPDIITSAPGRINLAGEHTDYNEGFVLPVAIDRRTYTAVAKRGGKICIAFSKELGKKTSFEILSGRFEHSNFWVNYIKGACVLLNDMKPIEGTNFAIGSTVPRGSGLGSSTAYVISIIEAISRVYDIHLNDIDVPLMAQRIENEFVGVESGIIDPFIAKFAKAGNALLVDTRSLEYQYVPLLQDCSILVCVTGTKRALATTEYNKRRQQCRQALSSLSEKLDKKITALRDVTLDELKGVEHNIDHVLYLRALHVVSENERVVKTASALRSGLKSLVGKLMLESHMSLRTNYEVSSPELDAFVEISEQLEGVHGARLTGAGFGGSAICLVDSDKGTELAEEIASRYKRRGFEDGHVFIAKSESGSRIEGGL